MTLGGNNDWSGATVILGGGLVIGNANLSEGIFMDPNTSIAFDQGSDGTVSGAILGDGTTTFEKLGRDEALLGG